MKITSPMTKFVSVLGVFAAFGLSIGPGQTFGQVSLSGPGRGTSSSGMFGTTSLGAGTTSNNQSASRAGATSGTSAGTQGTGMAMGLSGQTATTQSMQGRGFVGSSTDNV